MNAALTPFKDTIQLEYDHDVQRVIACLDDSSPRVRAAALNMIGTLAQHCELTWRRKW
jgi:hypothetical protein